MSCAGLELGIQQWGWSKEKDAVRMTGIGAVGRAKALIAQVWAGGMSYSLQEHQRAPWKLSWGQKRKQCCQRVFRGVGRSDVFTSVWGLTSLSCYGSVGGGDDFKASRCRLMLRVFTVSWCVRDMLGPPHCTWPVCLRDGEKKHMQGGWFSHHNLLCSFPSLRECLCASTCTNLREVNAVAFTPYSVLSWR